jgi:ribonuclease D
LFTFIDTLDDLAFLNKELTQRPHLGIDTEFRRTTKDNMRLALLQVNDEEEIYLIDAIQIKDPGEHVSFLFSDSVIKILHSCKEDLEAIFAWTNKELVNIFDTQIANSFLDGEYTIGYQGLVEQELGIVLDKNETRSNWIRRPLSDSQLKYAALDVEYLIHLYKFQKEELSRSNKMIWLEQDIQRLLRLTFNPSKSVIELERSMSRAQEAELLQRFNSIVDTISDQEEINPTLFFSKKLQKDFLRLVLNKGLDVACDEITAWRSNLIRDRLLDLLK